MIGCHLLLPVYNNKTPLNQTDHVIIHVTAKRGRRSLTEFSNVTRCRFGRPKLDVRFALRSVSRNPTLLLDSEYVSKKFWVDFN